MRRGPLEFLLLASLEDGPLYGLRIIQDVQDKTGGNFRFKEGTLYPALRRLEARGWRRSEQVYPSLSALALLGLVGVLAPVPLELLAADRDLRASFGPNLTAPQLREEDYITVSEVPLDMGGGVEMAAPQPLLEVRPSHLYVQPCTWPSVLARAGWPLGRLKA